MRPRRAIRIPIIALVATITAVSALGGVAWATFTSATTATQNLSSLQLGNPASAAATVNASTPTTCTSITITWPAATSADAYRIQVRENLGAWTDLITETADVTTHTDTTTHTNASVEYRVHARDSGSDWEGAAPATSAAVSCGFAPVTDLVATNPCSVTTLTWSAPPGASAYDVQRRVNGGAWTTLVTNQATTGYTDATVHAPGSVVDYQVRPGSLTADGAWTSSATIGSWEPFRVTSIVAGNSGLLGTLNAGDTVAVTFSKPVVPASVAVNSVRVDNSGGNRGLYLAASASATTGIGRLTTAATMFNASAAYAGSAASAWSGGNTTYTWVSNVAGATMASALNNETFTAGTGPRCAADGTSPLNGTYQPTSSGRW